VISFKEITAAIINRLRSLFDINEKQGSGK